MKTLGFRPNQRIWDKVNQAILGENAGESIATMISGLSMLLVENGISKDERSARVHLAAILISPDTAPMPGSLLPQLMEEIKRFGAPG